MKKQLFIDHLKKEVRIIPNTHRVRNGIEWHINDLKKLKAFFEYINFDCNIKPTGGCKQYARVTRCCCSSCYDSCGYFRIMLSENITYYARHFQRSGFWRKDKGCILPHKMRSITCLTTHCNYDNPKKYLGFSIGISLIEDAMCQDRTAILRAID